MSKPLTNAKARVLMAAAQNVMISPIKPATNAQEARLRVGARIDDGYLAIARLCEADGHLKIGQRSNGMRWVQLTDAGRRALAEYRNGPPSWREQLIELATVHGVDLNTMAERLIFKAWQEQAGWARDLPALKAAMAAAHPDRGGSNEGFIEAHDRYQQAKKSLATGSARYGRRKSKGIRGSKKP